MKGFPARHSEPRDELVLPGTQQGILPDGCRAKASTLPKPLSRCNISHVLYINPVCMYISFAPMTNWTQGHLTVQTAHCALHCTTNKLGQIYVEICLSLFGLTVIRGTQTAQTAHCALHCCFPIYP